MIDAEEFYDCAARYINDGPQSGISPNVKWVENRYNRYVLVEFIKNVRKGEEIFISYGSSYWENI
jgi:SET domain-containing protein